MPCFLLKNKEAVKALELTRDINLEKWIGEMKNHPGITIIGCGPGNMDKITREAWQIMNEADELYFRSGSLFNTDQLPDSVEIHTFDHLYNNAEVFEDVYQAIVDCIIELGKRGSGVIYCVPGHPFVAETTAPAIVSRALKENIPCRIVEGMSFLEPVFTHLKVDPFDGLILIDALQVKNFLLPPVNFGKSLLIAQIYSKEIASEVKLMLTAVYPDEYPVIMVHGAGTGETVVERICLYEIDRSLHTGLTTTLYVSKWEEESTFEYLLNVIARLRAPDGCPWDMEQTHLSLRPYLLEEAYETVEALDQEDAAKLQEELGDLLLQIVLHAQIASEAGDFNIFDVLKGISHKLVSRHPHVFASEKVESVDKVLQNWEKLKDKERKEKGEKQLNGLLRGVSSGLPALIQAQQYQARTARVGFDWPDIDGVKAKIIEEIDEVNLALNQKQLEAEIGDLLFSIVNLARWHNLDAESALRKSNTRFKNRFEYIEKKIEENDQQLGMLSQKEMDVYWDEAKSIQK